MREYNHTMGECQRCVVRIVLTWQLRQRKRDCPRVVTHIETVGEFGPLTRDPWAQAQVYLPLKSSNPSSELNISMHFICLIAYQCTYLLISFFIHGLFYLV